MESPQSPSVLTRGNVVGLSVGPSGRVVSTVCGDGVSVVGFEGGDNKVLQSWALRGDADGASCGVACGPAVYQRHGGELCLPMRSESAGAGAAKGAAGGKRDSKKVSGDHAESFLYVWNIRDVESKNVRHVSRRVVLRNSGDGAIAGVEALRESRASVRRSGGAGSGCDQWIGGWLVAMQDGRVGLVGGRDGGEDCTHGGGLGGDELVILIDGGKGKMKRLVRSICTQEGGFRVVSQIQTQKTPRTTLILEQWRLGAYPGVERVGEVALEVPGGPHTVGDASISVGMVGDRVLVVSGRSVHVYQVGKDESEGVVVPMITRVLASNHGESGKKRQKGGGETTAAVTAAFTDARSRGYIVQSSLKGLARVMVLDLLYGSVLWSGSVQGCEGAVTQGVAILSDSVGNSVESVELCLASPGHSVVRLSIQIPKPSLASVVGSLCIGSSKTTSTSALAEHARAVLDAESQMGVQSKRLGKVAVELGGDPEETKRKKASSVPQANALLQKSAQVTWTPAMSSDVEEMEDKLAGLLRMDGHMDAKSKADLTKIVTSVLDKCKKQEVSMASAVSARALVALIDTKQWKLVSMLLEVSHPRSHAHCAGAALALAEHAQYAELFSLLRHAPDITPSELTATIKCLLEISKKNEKAMMAFSDTVATAADKELSKFEKAKKSRNTNTSMSSACLAAAAINGFSPRQVACHVLLALHPDTSLLLSATKRLHSQQLIFFLRYLLQWLNNVTEMDVVKGGVPDGMHHLLVPSLDTLLIWLSCVVDAGNMRLSSSDAGMSVLECLLEEVRLQMSCIKGLEHLSGLLEQLGHCNHSGRRRGPAEIATGGYIVECINL